jgi:hypothetical protein
MKGEIFMGKMSIASTVLTCLGAGGVVITAVSAAKATPKAMGLINDAVIAKGAPLTKGEKFKAAAPAYVKTGLIGLASIGCIFGANMLNKRTQASLMSAYAMLDTSYKEYRNKVDEIYGEGSDNKIVAEMVRDQEEEEFEIEEGEKLFFDMTTMRYFTAPMEEIIQKATLEGGNECYIINTPNEFMMDI